MTNKTKAAIEEAAKLPTAEQLLSDTYKKHGWRYQPNIVGGCPHEHIALEAIESHTAAHTAALDKYNSLLIEEKKVLQERVKELEGLLTIWVKQNNYLRRHSISDFDDIHNQTKNALKK